MSSSAIVPTCQARAFHHASELPKEVWDALWEHEARANLILPFAEKALGSPREDSENLWIVVYNAGRVELVLSCTKGLVDNYPIFIVPCKSADKIAQEERREKSIADALSPLVRCLLEEVPPQRVFSIFSVAEVAEKFAEIFVAQVPEGLGIKAIQDPYYDATFTFCTSETLKEPPNVVSPFPGSKDVEIAIRPGAISDLKEITALCKAFSETSPPYILDDAGAKLEAESMIVNQQVWVHVIKQDGQEPEIACIVATTRASEDVTTVSKVFTSPRWRGHGCAARLLYRVCQDVLKKTKKIVLYVGNSKELEPARKVYHKIGFQGLIPGRPVKDVEKWLEVGFEGTKLGYW